MNIFKKYIKFLYIFLFINTVSFANYCEQIITINFTPEKGIKIYGVVGGGNDKRGIVDLGHFSGTETEKIIKVGKIEVTVEMRKTETEQINKNDVEIVYLDKLMNSIWNYRYDITSFIKDSNGTTAEIRVEDTQIHEGNSENRVIIFSCEDGEEHGHQRLRYSFDLILELRGMQTGGMYGISSNKEDGTKAYINLRDLINDQLNGRNLGRMK